MFSCSTIPLHTRVHTHLLSYDLASFPILVLPLSLSVCMCFILGINYAAAVCVQALDAMAEIQERHEAIKDLEESLLDLHQIFLDMSVQVDAQGEMLDNIEQQVDLIGCMLKEHFGAALACVSMSLPLHLKPVVLTMYKS